MCLQQPAEAARERSEEADEEEATAAAAEGAGAEEAAGSEPPLLTWDEIMSHRFLADFWVVIDGFVYDMTCALRPSSCSVTAHRTDGAWPELSTQ